MQGVRSSSLLGSIRDPPKPGLRAGFFIGIQDPVALQTRFRCTVYTQALVAVATVLARSSPRGTQAKAAGNGAAGTRHMP